MTKKYGETLVPNLQGDGELRNSFVTIGLGNGLWVNVPSIIELRNDRRRSLFRFSLDGGTEDPRVRIVGKEVNRRGQTLPEPEDTSFLGNADFIPRRGYEVSQTEMPQVLARTFGFPEWLGENAQALNSEYDRALERGWLGVVVGTQHLDRIMPGNRAVL